MKAFFLMFWICFILGPMLFADDLKPPIPLPAGDSADLLPPPLDLSQMTPLPLPENPKAEPAKSETAITPTTGSTSSPLGPNKSTSYDSALKPLKETQPDLISPVLVATATSDKSSEVNKNVGSIVTPTTEVPPALPVEKKAASATAHSLGLFADYFPNTQGAKWNYEYLKPEAGTKSKKTKTVECSEQTQNSNGVVQITMETTEDGQTTKDTYILSENQVEHVNAGDQVLTGDFIFKLPPSGGAATWSVTEKNGTLHKSKASFGKAQVYQKTYPDCIIVTEKVIVGGKPANTVIYYYAKEIGLVAIEVYSPKLKLLQTKSIALVSGPIAASN